MGVDGRAFASPAAGVRRYVSSLVRALVALGEPIEVVALGGGDPGAIPNGVDHVAEPAHPPTNLGWTLVGLPRAATRARVHLIHAPAYTAPIWTPVPVVVTIHDVSYARRPEWYPYRRDVARRLFYRSSARAAAHIITDSEFSASEIAAAYGIARSRMTVVPLGVAPAFTPDDEGTTGGAGSAGVEGPYVLHVGDLHERRNLAVVVEALLRARETGACRAISLVLAGLDRGAGESLSRLASAAGVPEIVVRLGAVSEARLRQLYRHATALVYPSRYEGFGLPVLEAMASGVPVIASRAASIPEVLGEAGLLLDPTDVGAWAQAMIQVVADGTLRGRMRAAGLARAATFTWTRTGHATLDVYRLVISQSRRRAPRAEGPGDDS